MIHRFPTESETRDHVDANERSGLGKHAGGIPGLPAAARTQGCGRPVVPGSDALLHGGERSLARAAGAVRPLELGMETLRPAEQGGCVRGLLRHAGVDERIGASHSDVRFHHRARPCFGCGRKRGAARPGARALARRVHDQNPCQIRCIGSADRFRPDRRRKGRRTAFPHPARHRTGHHAPRRHRRQGLFQQGQSRRRASQRHSPGHPAQNSGGLQTGFPVIPQALANPAALAHHGHSTGGAFPVLPALGERSDLGGPLRCLQPGLLMLHEGHLHL